ncbi:hypothetical protein [Rosistilla ulvae]|uniref:hypothetical protein n=1 Tax=Rosistilla ulvae TaxID=1930277 RepID=UPI0011A495C2|nr:hypothetical protein [Rosistilla ulvae]
MPKKKTIVPEKVKSRSITSVQRNAALRRIQDSVALSPLLTQLEVGVVQRGSHFYLEYDYAGVPLPVARITPMKGSPAFALESEAADAWVLYGQGTPSRIVKLLCNDTLGTFHALGSIDQTLRNAHGKIPEIVQTTPRTFVYKDTRLPCSLQEALHFYYGIPLVVVMEPRAFYSQHAEPSLLETSDDNCQILVRFCSRNPARPQIVGHGYYRYLDGDWYGIGVPPEIANTLDEAEAYLMLSL